MPEPQIVEKPELTVIGLRKAFIHALSPDSTAAEVLGPLWGDFLSRAGSVPNRRGEEMFGIIYGEDESERSHPHELQYIAAVGVSSTADIPEGMVSWTVPATTFAVVTHRGPIETLRDTVHDLYRVWLPESPYKHSGIADVELYDDRFCYDREDSEMEYGISVEPK